MVHIELKPYKSLLLILNEDIIIKKIRSFPKIPEYTQIF